MGKSKNQVIEMPREKKKLWAVLSFPIHGECLEKIRVFEKREEKIISKDKL